MKFKFMLLALVVSTSGCANVSEPRNELTFIPGQGIGYFYKSNQMGGNAGKYAALEAKMRQEREQNAVANKERLEKAWEQESQAYRDQAIANSCMHKVNLRLALLQENYYDTIQSEGYEKAQEASKVLIKAKRSAMVDVNKCIEESK